MKKQFLLLSLCLLSMSVSQAKDINDTQLTQEQVQALHQQTISEFKSDFQVVLDNYNNYIDHNQEQVGLRGCLNNLDTQLKDDFNHYQWNSYQDIDISKIPLKVQSKLSTLSELSKDENNLNYYYYGKIFSIESKNEALLDEIAPQLFPYFLNTQLVKDQDFSKKTYIIKYVMIKNMSASEYNKMITLVNQQTNAAILCTNQYINHPDNNLYNNFILSFKNFDKRYRSVFNDLLDNHSLDEKVTLHFIDGNSFNFNRFNYDDSSIKIYKNGNNYMAQLSYYQAIIFMARNTRYAYNSTENQIYNTQQSIINKSKQAKSEIDALF